MKSKGKSLELVCLFILNMIAVTSLSAQDTLSKNKWNTLIEPYLMFPNMHGTVGIGTLPDAEVDQNPGDIFSKLQFGAMLYGETYNANWAITSDLTYMKLGENAEGKRGIISGDVDIKQFTWELAGLRRITPWLEAGLALQLNSLKNSADLRIQSPSGVMSKSAERNETWVDPGIVTRVKIPTGKWLFQFRGNIGGFGIGSDFYWQLQAYAGYRFSKLFLLSAGYRVIGVDYKKGKDSNRFLYNMNMFGPVIRLGFNF